MQDDDEVLTDYVLRHYPDLLNDWERRVFRADLCRTKLGENPKYRWSPGFVRAAGVGLPEVDAALADGVGAFRRRVRVRLLVEHGDAIFINRCPRCGRLTRTPLARRCLDCGRDWHHEPPG